MDYETRIAQLETQVAALQSELSELKGRCPCLVSKLLALRERPTELEVELRRIGDRKREHEKP